MRLRPEKREWNVLLCTLPLPFLCPEPPPHSGLSQNFLINMNPILPHRKTPGTYCLCTVPGVFSMVETTSASRPALNRKSSRISDDYEIVGNKRAACFTSGREGFSIPSFLQKCHSQNPSPAIPVELHRQRTRGSRPYGHSDALPNGIKSDRRNSCRFFAV